MLLSVTLFPQSQCILVAFGKTKDNVRLLTLTLTICLLIRFKESRCIRIASERFCRIRGRAVAGRARLAVYRYLLMIKRTGSLQLNDDGAFNFKFRPVTDKTYKIYVEAMETAGKTNEISETYKG